MICIKFCFESSIILVTFSVCWVIRLFINVIFMKWIIGYLYEYCGEKLHRRTLCHFRPESHRMWLIIIIYYWSPINWPKLPTTTATGSRRPVHYVLTYSFPAAVDASSPNILNIINYHSVFFQKYGVVTAGGRVSYPFWYKYVCIYYYYYCYLYTFSFCRPVAGHWDQIMYYYSNICYGKRFVNIYKVSCLIEKYWCILNYIILYSVKEWTARPRIPTTKPASLQALVSAATKLHMST